MKPEKIREAIKEANKWGIKGKSLAQLSRSAARNLSSDAKGLTREQIQKGIREAGKEIGNKKTLASRVQPGQVSLIKKGLM